MVSSDPFNLARFTAAQKVSYARALAEIKGGKKTSHWMWYISPQLTRLAQSAKSERYAITSLEEARAYLAHPVLGARLAEITQAVLDHKTETARALMGTPDFMKLHACMTLFIRADPKQEVFGFQAVLDKYYKGVPQVLTDDILGIDKKYVW
jgi:uncharacterized protein (DUF1810 family)